MPSINAEKRHFWLGFALVMLGALGFSAKAVIIKLVYAADVHIDPITLMTLRMVLSAPFFVLASIWHNTSKPAPLSSRQWLAIILLGVIGYYLSSLLDFSGLSYISAGLERIILFLYPTFVVLLSSLVYRRTITRYSVLALLLCYAGMILVFIEQLNLNSANIWLGSSLVFASACIFAGFTMGSGIMTALIGSTRFTAYTMLVASSATLIHFCVVYGFEVPKLTFDVYALISIMALFCTVLPAFFMNAGIRQIGAANASIISTTGPIGTLILAYFLLNEPFSVNQLLGTLLVLTGVYTVSRAKN